MKRFLFVFLVRLAAVAVHATETRPNIVWILGEDLELELGSFGDPDALTPNMDRMAREDARFRNCFTNAPACAPICPT